MGNSSIENSSSSSKSFDVLSILRSSSLLSMFSCDCLGGLFKVGFECKSVMLSFFNSSLSFCFSFKIFTLSKF